MKRLFLALSLLCGLIATAAEPLHLSFVVHGRSPLEPQHADRPDYGLVESVVFAGEPIIATLTVINGPTDNVITWAEGVQWDAVDADGNAATPSVTVAATAPARPGATAGAVRVNVNVTGLAPGRYTLRAKWADPITGQRAVAEDRKLSIYRGDENVIVKRAFLRERAKAALAQGTKEGYHAARTMLLEAAKGNTDPSVYELLADASAPWASPDETAEFYDRSLAVAKENLSRRFGKQQEWPEKATSLFTVRERKVNTFRELVPYYKSNFADVRVVVTRHGAADRFVVERRRDGSRLRVIQPHE